MVVINNALREEVIKKASHIMAENMAIDYNRAKIIIDKYSELKSISGEMLEFVESATTKKIKDLYKKRLEDIFGDLK